MLKNIFWTFWSALIEHAGVLEQLVCPLSLDNNDSWLKKQEQGKAGSFFCGGGLTTGLTQAELALLEVLEPR